MSHRFNDGYVKPDSDGYAKLRKDGYVFLSTDGYLLSLKASGANGKVTIDINGSTVANVTPTGLRVGDSTTATEKLEVVGNIKIDTSIISPKIFQGDKTTASGTGETLTIQAQNETGTTSTGGILDFRSGTGTSTAGIITLRFGNSIIATVNATGIDLTPTGGAATGSFRSYTAAVSYNGFYLGGVTPGSSNFSVLSNGTNLLLNAPLSTGQIQISAGNNNICTYDFTNHSIFIGSTITNPKFYQADKVTASGTGETLTIQAQNETGTGTTVGGALIFATGTGTTAGAFTGKLGNNTFISATSTITTLQYQGSATNYVSINATTVEIGGSLNLAVSTATTATGGAQTLPANPDGFIIVNVGGVAKKIAIYNT